MKRHAHSDLDALQRIFPKGFEVVRAGSLLYWVAVPHPSLLTSWTPTVATETRFPGYCWGLPVPPTLRTCLLALAGALFLGGPAARAEEFEAVASSVSAGYARSKLPDGSFRPETYVFKEGGYLSGELADDTIDKMTFKDVSQSIAGPLASQKYFPALDPASGSLLIVVYWGTTRAPAEKAPSSIVAKMTEQLGPPSSRVTPFTVGPTGLRDQYLFQAKAANFAGAMVDREDAMMLGYDSAADPDLRTYRYFVVLLAYDLQDLLKERRPKLLWQTRFSVSEHRNQFDKQLRLMAVVASKYFGRDSLGLRHDSVPEGRVEVGEARALGTVDVPDYAVLAPDGAHVAYLRSIKSTLELAIVDIDRPGRLAYGRFPKSALPPTQLAWSDPGHVRVTLSSSEALSYDVEGRRSPAAAQEAPGGAPAQSPGADLQALVDGKFPHRTVAVAGSDASGRRYLLSVSGGAGPTRFFVLDRPDDLLYEVGRSEHSP